MRGSRFVGLCVLIAAVLVAACAPPPSGGGETAIGDERAGTPKRLVAAIRGNPKFVSNALNSGGGGRIDGGVELGGLVNSHLSVQDGAGQFIPALAERMPTVENGLWKVLPDGRMETTWVIREGAAWHDGTPFTAQDLVFTARISQDAEMPWLVDRVYRFVEGVEAADFRTIRITWKEPYIRADNSSTSGGGGGVLFNPPFPQHLLEQAYSGDRDSFPNLPYWTTDFVGNGPFRVKEFARDSHVTLAAFDAYILGRPKIDEIEVRFIPDDNALAANMLAGAVDLAFGPGFSIEQAIQVRDRWPQGRMTTGRSGWINMNPQFLNPDPPILLNLQFRRALYIAIDRKQLADELMYGFSDEAHSSISPSEPEYAHIDSYIVRHAHDPRRGAQMIEELGYTKGPDGMFQDASARPLSIQIMATPDDSNQKPQFAVLDMWKSIGVTPDAEIVTQQRQRDLAYRANFRNFSLQAGVGYGPEGVNGLLSREARTAERNYVGGNYIRYMNPEIDTLVERYFTTIPFAERMQLLGQIVRHTTENHIWMPLYWRVLPTLAHERVAGVAPIGEGNQWWNAHLWDVR